MDDEAMAEEFLFTPDARPRHLCCRHLSSNRKNRGTNVSLADVILIMVVVQRRRKEEGHHRYTVTGTTIIDDTNYSIQYNIEIE